MEIVREGILGTPSRYERTNYDYVLSLIRTQQLVAVNYSRYSKRKSYYVTGENLAAYLREKKIEHKIL